MDTLHIAKQIKETIETIVLIYAFNSTGKTRLCVEYKNMTKDQESGKHAGVYYNSFSEDLFVWDNDEDNDNAEIKLNILYSSLSQFHSLVTKEVLEEKLTLYAPKYNFELIQNDNPELGIEAVRFFVETEHGNKAIKISRGEERIFVWCFFLALFDLGTWTDELNAHYFIDDPVSSLDDHNIFITANSIINIIEKSDIKKKKIIITTHHLGLFSILYDRLKKGEKSSSYKSLTKCWILKNEDGELLLKRHDKDVFLYHLHLLQTIDTAIKEQLYGYHFVLLRQLLENIGSFLGVGRPSFVLEQIGLAKENAEIVNALSHKNVYTMQHHEMSPEEENLFKDTFQKIQEKYNFVIHN